MIAGNHDPGGFTDVRASPALSFVHALHPLEQSFVDAIVSGDRNRAIELVLDYVSAHALTDPTDLYDYVIQEALYETGVRWELGDITISQEHRATAIVQEVLTLARERLPVQTANHGRVVVVGVEAELHQVGARIVSDLLQVWGWDVDFLGTDVPSIDVVRQLQLNLPSVLCVSVTLERGLPLAQRLIANVRAELGRQIQIIVGGQAFVRSPAAQTSLGADGYGTGPRSAHALCLELTRKG